MQARTADVSFIEAEPAESLFQRIWPPVFIGCGLGLTAAWVSFLGYAVVRFIIA
jgi:hypothetical protein